MDVHPAAAGPWLLDTPGQVLGLFRRRGAGLTKNDVARLSGLSRTAAAQRVDLLRASGYLELLTPPGAARGRPAELFGVARGRGVILVADTGATAMRVALCDATGAVLLEHLADSDVTDGPERVLERVGRSFEALLRESRRSRADVLAIGIDVPGPVDHATGRVVSPPIMTGWHDYAIPAYFASYRCPVVVEKDANAMVLGEHYQVHPGVENMVFVKIGTGVGTGLFIRGELYRGSDGAAGDVGHIPVAAIEENAPLCRCGNRGCVEAHASGWALARDLREAGIPATSVGDIVSAVRDGNRTALTMVRTAGRIIGAAVSDIVNLINPRLVVFGGQLAALDDIILAAAREVIYHRSLPLATRNLRIEPSAIPNPGVHGLARLAVDQLLSPDTVDAEIQASS